MEILELRKEKAKSNRMNNGMNEESDDGDFYEKQNQQTSEKAKSSSRGLQISLDDFIQVD